MKTRIYLDQCAFNRPFDSQDNIRNRLETIAKLHIQQGIKDGKYELVWSYMSDYENHNNPNSENRNAIQLWESYATFRCLSSVLIPYLAKEIECKGIRSKDALHIACAIESNCEYFITTDKKLENKTIDNILIVNPINFIQIMEEI